MLVKIGSFQICYNFLLQLGLVLFQYYIIKAQALIGGLYHNVHTWAFLVSKVEKVELRDFREESCEELRRRVGLLLHQLQIGVGVKYLPPKSQGQSTYIFFK